MENSILKPHAILVSSPGIGHLIPNLELGKRLATLQNFEVTIYVVASQTSAAESEIIQAAMSTKHYELIELPLPDISTLVDPGSSAVERLAITMREIKPTLCASISALKSRPTMLIVDLFATESLLIADQLKIPKYVFIASNAWFLALTVYCPTLDEVVQGQYVDQKEPLFIPGCKPVRPEDVVDPMLDRNAQQYFEYLRVGEDISSSDGILLNIWEDLQPTTIAALRDDKLLGAVVNAPIYTIGPVVRPIGRPSGSEKELFDWLDKQPSESVLYVSLGSGGTLSFDQTNELALGLELSQQRFIWVLRPPTAKSGDGSFFTAGKGGDEFSSCLPEGFLTRIGDVGLVVPQWASQVNILSHPSVGGYLSHTGWNSTLESITNEVPMIAWPLYAEQRMNATLLTEELGVAVKSKVLPSKGVVSREEIKMMVRRIMVDEEGHAIRAKVKELKRSADEAWSSDGSSFNSLSLFCKECRVSKSKKRQEVKALREQEYGDVEE